MRLGHTPNAFGFFLFFRFAMLLVNNKDTVMAFRLINREDGSCDVIFNATDSAVIDGTLAFNCPDRDRALVAADEVEYVFGHCVPGYRSDGARTIRDQTFAETAQ